MHDVPYRTLVYWITPSPLGPVGNRWAIEHRCLLCHDAVATDQLLPHTRTHAPVEHQSPTSATCPSRKPPGSQPLLRNHSR